MRRFKEYKITFIKDFSPRKKGEVLEVKTQEDDKLARWYLGNGIAKKCDCNSGVSGCSGCKKQAEAKKRRRRKKVVIEDVKEEVKDAE